jgi:intein-encoded DNA endonuclease-like protein
MVFAAARELQRGTISLKELREKVRKEVGYEISERTFRRWVAAARAAGEV